MSEINHQPTYKRQRFLLAFIRQLHDGVTATDLQKLVFLYTMKEGSDFYEFIPYKFGPYSFQLAEDVNILRRDGYLFIESRPGGTKIQAIGEYPQESAFSIASERGINLIRKTYREYPYYAINSEITDRLFHGNEAECIKKEKKNYTKSGQVLFTIGYEGKSIEGFINTLIQNDVRLLCDVRKNPVSRKFGFSKRKLVHITETVGIGCVHMPDLGIESHKRSSLETVDDYKCLFRGYAKTLLNLKPQLERLYSLLNEHDRIALMCYEKDADMCHRHVIRDYLTKRHPIRSVDL
ncbi:MAG: DUF488 family protein [Thermoanaerobacterales bacterium]|jgi:uncharacterized protein (DUF488 family)|nr:DUF488 family protein [Thermoanaerobacterales bacterium]